MTKRRLISNILFYASFVVACSALFFYLFQETDNSILNSTDWGNGIMFERPDQSVFILIAVAVLIFTVGFGIRNSE